MAYDRDRWNQDWERERESEFNRGQSFRAGPDGWSGEEGFRQRGSQGMGGRGREMEGPDYYGPSSRGGYGGSYGGSQQGWQGGYQGGGYGGGGRFGPEYGPTGFGYGGGFGVEGRRGFEAGQGYGGGSYGGGLGTSGYGGYQGGYGFQGSQGRYAGGYGPGAREEGWGGGVQGEFSGSGIATGRSTRYGSQTRYGRTPQGRYTGRGPKGYSRSDERIEEEINETLARDPDIDASEIEVKVENGMVTLTGTVEEREQKREVEDLVESVFGVKDVENRLRVSGQPVGAGKQESHRESGRTVKV